MSFTKDLSKDMNKGYSRENPLAEPTEVIWFCNCFSGVVGYSRLPTVRFANVGGSGSFVNESDILQQKSNAEICEEIGQIFRWRWL